MLKTSKGIKFNPVGKLNFPGYQELLDFTSAGGEASKSVTIDGATDKEYLVYIRNTGAQRIYGRVNNNSTSGQYGMQFLDNSSGTISAGRSATITRVVSCSGLGFSVSSFNALSGFQKTALSAEGIYSSGTTITGHAIYGLTYINTANATTLDFLPASGNFEAGTRIVVYVRRSNV